MDYFKGLNAVMDELDGLTVKIESHLCELKSNLYDLVELNDSYFKNFAILNNSILLDKYLKKISRS